MFGIGAGELIIILIAGLVIFGPGKLPEVGRSLGKVLREFRKAQAAFSATLDEVSAEPKPKSTTTTTPPPQTPAAEPKPTTEKISLDKPPAEKIVAEKNSPEENSVKVDDVINMAKQNPFAKENVNEKIFSGVDSVASGANVSQRVEPARGGGDSTTK